MRRTWFLISLLTFAMAVTAAAEGHPAAQPFTVRLALNLTDGSRIIGEPDINSLELATEYSDLELPLSLLRTIELSGTDHLAHAGLKNGDLLSGHLAAANIRLNTIFGNAVIPMAAVHRIEVRNAGLGAAHEPLPDGLVLRYTFDIDEGDHVTDMSDGGNNGKVQGATYTSQGKVGGAMSFNGDRVAVVIGNPACLQLQNFTIMAWIKRGDVTKPGAREGEDAELFGYGHGGYMLGMCTDGRLFLSKVDVNDVDSQFNIHDDAFHQVAVTKQGSQIVYYLDGIGYRGPDYDPGFEFTTDAAVGSRPDLMVHSFLGIIDEVAIFNRALSGDEIKGVYDAEK